MEVCSVFILGRIFEGFLLVIINYITNLIVVSLTCIKDSQHNIGVQAVKKKKKRRRRRSLKWTDELISIGNCQQYFRIFFLFFVFCFFYQRSPQSYSPGPVVQRVDNAIHFINFYPANKELLFAILIRWGVLSNVWTTGARLPLCMQGTYVASVRTSSRSLSWWPVKGN